MSEPDELYTLRAQFWLGHYQMAVEEAKSIARRPMSVALKQEREEFLARAYLHLGQVDKIATVSVDASAGVKMVELQALYGTSADEGTKDAVLTQVKTLLASSHHTSPAVRLVAAQVFVSAGQTKEALHALQMSSSNNTLEIVSMLLQIYVKMDRLDLAKQQLQILKQTDEDSVLTSLSSVHVHLATGKTGAADALHTLNALSEQYGPSPLLLNLTACALMLSADYMAAQGRLEECLRDFANETAVLPDTLINMIVCLVQQNQAPDEYVAKMKQMYPNHTFVAGLDRVLGAFEREAIKYKV